MMMCFEGLVLVDVMVDLKVGEIVWFKVNGVEVGDFQGCLWCIDVLVNLIMWQVVVFVDFVGEKVLMVVGFYVEGCVQMKSVSVLMFLEVFIQCEGDKVYVWVLCGDGKFVKVVLKFGQCDDCLVQYQVLEGLKNGDCILCKLGSIFSDGCYFEMSGKLVVVMVFLLVLVVLGG